MTFGDPPANPTNDNETPEQRIARLEAELAASKAPPAPPANEPPVAPSELERELAFAKQGINISEPLGVAAAQSYKGDIADPDAIKAYARSLGIKLDEGTPPPSSGSAAREALAAGAPSYEPPPEAKDDPYELMRKHARVGIEAHDPTEAVLGRAVMDITGAYVNGDTRVLVKERHAARLKDWEERGVVPDRV